MRKILTWLNNKLGIYHTQKSINKRLFILEKQLDLLLRSSKKTTRWKWKRMLENPRSPFYIFK